MTESLTYGGYLALEPLLALQRPRSAPEHHDEMLFIVVHQSSELWFKLILHELGHLSALLERDETLAAIETLLRINDVVRIVTAQFHALDTLSPQQFAQFRGYLGTSSGSQSMQFRAIELWSGLRAPEYLQYLRSQGELPPQLREALERPSLPELFDALLRRAGVTAEELYTSDAHRPLRLLAEQLLEYEQLFGQWRFQHVQLVERILGPDTGGTGGSAGAQALRATLQNRFFPELWAIRAKFY